MSSRSLGNFLSVDFNSCMAEWDYDHPKKHMFESLIVTGLQTFLEESGPILIEDVKEFFRNACNWGDQDEEWAPEETDPERTEDETVHDDDHSARSPNDAEQSANPETTEGEEGGDTGANDEGHDREEADEAEAERLAQNIFHGINKRDEDVIDLYLEWHEYRFNTKYRDILPNSPQQDCIARLEEQVPVYTAPVIEEFPVDCPTPSREEVETPRDIEAPMQEDVEVPTSKIVEVQILEDVEVPISEIAATNLEDAVTLEPPNENAALIDSSERADPDPTEQSIPSPPPEATASAPPKEQIEDRLQKFEASVSGRIDDQLKKFEMSISGQIEDRLQQLDASISERIDDRVQMAEILKAKENADAAAIEADALVAKKVQDALDVEASKDKGAPRSSQLTEADLEAERIRRAEILYPGYAEKVASQAAEDAARLEREVQQSSDFGQQQQSSVAKCSRRRFLVSRSKQQESQVTRCSKRRSLVSNNNPRSPTIADIDLRLVAISNNSPWSPGATNMGLRSATANSGSPRSTDATSISLRSTTSSTTVFGRHMQSTSVLGQQ
ncbi:enolase-phosphatase E1-like [Impatiens glandulifera]|uniref:enolase-phosphatase E1-like n=1 Tax=Impatiens glandulifera TaxID=253017 RepID=UPI001FB09D62|nr:enolase-phosphatase E1-like [Impatiens glandulifera]